MKNIVTKTLIIVSLLSVCFASAERALAQENQLKDVIKLVIPATVLVMTYDAKGKPLAQGSGFFVSERGELITNYHVFNGAESIEIKCPDNSVYKITLVIAEDITSDLVKLQANTGSKKVPWLKLNKAKIEVGEKIVVIGSPQGLEATVSDGIVSAVRDVPGFGNIIQITAPISPGSSGSAVVNMKGVVIGVASAQMIEGQNLNFVVPAEKITTLKEKKHAVAASKPKGVAKQSNDIYSAAVAYYFKKDYKKALPLFKQYLQNNKNSANAWFYIGFCYGKLGRYPEAIEAYKQAIKLEPDDAAAHYNLGLAYGKLGLYPEAIEAYKQAIKLEPDFADAHSDLGVAYGKLGRFEGAIEAYKQAIKLKPDLAGAHNNLGTVYGNLGRWQEAIEAYKQAIRLNPDYAEAHHNLGLAYGKLGRHQEAGEAFKQAIKLKPDYAMAYNNLGNAYDELSRHEEAIEAFKQAIKLKPDYAMAYNNLGNAYDELNRHEEAIEAYRQAIKLKPDDADAHYDLGKAYLKIGNKGSALEEYKTLKTLDPKRADKLFNLMAQVVDADSSSSGLVSGYESMGDNLVKIALYKETGKVFKLTAIAELKGRITFNSKGIVGGVDGLLRLQLAESKDKWIPITKRELVDGRAVITTEDGKTYTIFNLGIGPFAGQIELRTDFREPLKSATQASANDQSTGEKYVVIQCGDIIYKLSVTGSNALTGTDYKDNEIAVSFPVANNNSLGLEIRNLSAKNLVAHWGSKDIKLRVGDSDKALVRTFKLGLYNPFIGGGLEELKSDMTIEPGKSELVFVGAFELQWGEKMELRQELLPLDATKAQELKGKAIKLMLPMLVNNKETTRSIEFVVKELSTDN